MSPKGKAALGYVQRLRWSVFPVAGDGKTPIKNEDLELGHGFKDASADAEVVSTWWTCLPDANLALACGLVSGVFVFDIDRKGEVDGFASLAAMEERHGPLPPTWTARTPSGGEHRYFKQPDKPLRCRVNLSVDCIDGGKVKYAGIDIRADGGSACLPPSVRPDGAYSWLRRPIETPLADAPDWLVGLIDPPQPPRPALPPLRLETTERMARYVAKAVDEECDELARMGPNTGRNQALFQASANLFSLVAANMLPSDHAQAALERAAQECGLVGEDGWHAVRATIASGQRRGFASPREVRL